MNFVSRIRNTRPLRCLGWISLLVFPLFCDLILEYYNAGGLAALLRFWNPRSPIPWFGLLVVTGLFLIALLLFGRAAPACAAVGILSLLIAFINYMKLALNGDHFFPKDILMAGEAGSLLSFLSGGLPKWMPLFILVLLLWCAGLAALDIRLPLGGPFRLFCASSAVVLIAVFCTGAARTMNLLNRFSFYTELTANQSANYEINGFTGAFLLNLNTMNVQPPRGYSEDRAEELLSGYETVEANRELFDVILVLSESFFDVREMPGLTFSRDPLTHYDELLSRDNCYSGKLYTNAICGGTVRPEFEVLTGLSSEVLPSGSTPYEYVLRPLEGYVSNYKDAGYRTLAIHPYLPSFYARNLAYPYLGFDEFYALDTLSETADLTYKRDYTTDESLEAVMEQLLDQAEEPTFLFAITMQNHQPFNPLPEEEIHLTVSSDRLSQDNLDAVTTYVQGLYDADRMLGRLAEYIDRRERPTVLIFFGDHKPTLGINFGAYDESGLFLVANGLETETRKEMYHTPFLIYANRELDPGLFQQNTGNELSSYYLLDAAALCTGFRLTPYMQLLLDSYQVLPYYNVRLNLPAVSQQAQEAIRAQEYITYRRLVD